MRLQRAATMGSAAILAGGLLTACSSGSSDEVVINLFGGASTPGFNQIIDQCNEAAAGEYRIVGNLLPSDADGQREQMVRRLAARDDGMDLLGTDVTWTAEFAEAGWIIALDDDQVAAATEDVLEAVVETALWQDEMYAIPKNTNVQLLWYRESLVDEPPATWEEMFQISSDLRDAGEPYEIAVTGSRYEGLVVAFNTLVASAGGTLVNEDSTEPTIDDSTIEALEILNELATSGLASRSLSNAQEPEVYADLEAGRAAFAINWPYVLASLRSAGATDASIAEVAEDVAAAPIPAVQDGEPVRSTLGGMNYAISSYSEHPDEAFDAAMCLRSPEHQLQHALNAGEPPVLESIYDDPEFQEAYPQGPVMLEALQTAVPRPISPLYQNISTIISSTLSPPSSIDPEETADELEDAISQAIDGRGILP